MPCNTQGRGWSPDAAVVERDQHSHGIGQQRRPGEDCEEKQVELQLSGKNRTQEDDQVQKERARARLLPSGPSYAP